MKKNYGFTLIEILISIALLTILSSFFLLLIVNHFKILNVTKGITEEVFLAQRVIEEEIDAVKKEIQDINDGITPDDPRTLHTQTIFETGLGGVEVEYYETEIDYNNRHYFTYVSNIKPEPLEKISLASIDSNMVHNGNDVEYGYATTDFSVVGEFSNSITYKYDHLLNQVEWYVASEKFIMPMPKSESFDMNDDLEYNSYYFPIFPRDYVLVDNETVFDFGTTSNTFALLEEYRGRHIMYTVTPAAKSGKLGIQKVSEPIFVSGLPVTDNLKMHFDASYIDLSIPAEVQTFGTSNFLWKWYDISSIIGHTAPTEYAQNSGQKPLVIRMVTGQSFIGQYVSFGNDQKLTITQSTSGELSVFSVVRNRSLYESSEYLTNGENVLSLESNNEEGYDFWILKEDVISADGNIFQIGGDNMDIAELIIYSGTLDSNEMAELESYIIGKYKDVIVSAGVLE